MACLKNSITHALWLGLVGCASSTAAPTPAPESPPSITEVPLEPATPAPPVLSSTRCSLPSDDALLRALLPIDPAKDKPGKHSHGPPGPIDPSAITRDMQLEVAALREAVDADRCRKIRYRSDGHEVAAFILEPPTVEAGAKLPVIIAARGGNRDLGTIKGRLLLDLFAVANQGFVVVATQYRGADGASGEDEFGGAELRDLHNLLPVARTLPSVDAEQLFLLGYSRGGMMAAMALREGIPVRAAAASSGLFDLEANAARRPVMARNFAELIPHFDTDREAQLHARSAVRWADEITTPLLLLGGSRDWRVSLEANSKVLASRMKEAGRDVRLVVYEDDHVLSHHRREAAREIASWFHEHMAK